MEERDVGGVAEAPGAGVPGDLLEDAEYGEPSHQPVGRLQAGFRDALGLLYRDRGLRVEMFQNEVAAPRRAPGVARDGVP